MNLNAKAFSTLKDDEVLFFIRIRGKKSYFNMVYTKPFLDLFEQLKEFKTISEYKKDADVHIDLNSIERDWLTHEEYKSFSEYIDINDVIHRCRGLRSIPYVEAKQLINRAYLFLSRFYEQNPSLKLIVTGAVDNYVMDLMHRVGKHYGVQFVGVTDSFMSPQYKLITVRGEASNFETASDEQAEAFYNKVKDAALSPIVPKKAKAIRHAIYCFGSYYYRYTVRYLIQHKLLKKLGYEYRFAPFLHLFKSPSQIFATRLLKPNSQLRFEKGQKYAYVPLHYCPEATIDYWFNDDFHVDYEESVLDTIQKLTAEGYQVVVKEHPAFYLARSGSTYRKLIGAGAILVSPFISTKEIFQKIDLVVVWNGSTGIEAIVHKKPVVKVTNSYYGDGIINGLDSASDPTTPTDELGLDVIKKVLASSFRTF